MRRQLRQSLRPQQHDSKILEMLPQGDALARSKRPLAAPSEMLHQTASYVQGFSKMNYSTPRLLGYMSEQAIYMVNSFQFTRSARLVLAHRP